MTDATLDEICAVAIADSFRGDGEILCNPIGTTPIVGGRLARATFEPDMVMTDTVAALATGIVPLGEPGFEKTLEAWMPYRDIFDVVWSGKRHVVMGASQIDQYGNQNLAAIGDWQQPKSQLLGLRGAPGNLINHPTTYWIPNHSTRSFVEKVDVVSGPGYDAVAELSEFIQQNHEIRRVVTNLGVFNFENDEHRMQVLTVHPGSSIDDIVENTSFEMIIPDTVEESRLPTDEELDLIRNHIDPHGLRKAEFRN